MDLRKNVFVASALSAVVLGAFGCGKSDSTQEVTVSSASFRSDTAAGSALAEATTPAPAVAVVDFKICIASIRLEGKSSDGKQAEDSGEIRFAPGLIDLSSGEARDWGKLNI